MSHPRICLSLYGTTEEICDAIRANDAELFEIRLDLSDQPSGTSIRAATSKPLVFTAHGRPDLIEQYSPFADYLDVEQHKVTGQNRIVSIHAEDQDPEMIWKKLSGHNRTKIVLETENYETIVQLLDLDRRNKPFAICFAAGEVGAFSRIASVLNGAPWIYASLAGRTTGPGQFTFDQVLFTFRFRRLDTTLDTSLFGIVGNPVSHSRSPEIQNRNFAEASLPWIYLPFLCKDLPALFKNAPKWNSKGFSITHPYKEAVLPLLDWISPEAERLKSCNTVAHVDGRWIGTNTDVKGISALLQDVPLNGLRIVIIGAGSSARAFASAVRPHASELLILNRHPQKAKELSREYQAQSGSLQDLKSYDYDLLIQATPVGWNSDEVPVSPEHLRSGKIVIDSIYKDTFLLKKAREMGCKTINGEKWFQVQAQAQFEWWKEVFKS